MKRIACSIWALFAILSGIIDLLPRRRQNLLFSATFSDDIRNLARGSLRKPIEISVSPRNTTAASVTQHIHPVDKKKKAQLLTRLIHDGKWDQALVFTKTKHGANKLTKHLESEGIVAAAIHGNKKSVLEPKRSRVLKPVKLEF